MLAPCSQLATGHVSSLAVTVCTCLSNEAALTWVSQFQPWLYIVPTSDEDLYWSRICLAVGRLSHRKGIPGNLWPGQKGHPFVVVVKMCDVSRVGYREWRAVPSILLKIFYFFPYGQNPKKLKMLNWLFQGIQGRSVQVTSLNSYCLREIDHIFLWTIQGPDAK